MVNKTRIFATGEEEYVNSWPKMIQQFEVKVRKNRKIEKGYLRKNINSIIISHLILEKRLLMPKYSTLRAKYTDKKEELLKLGTFPDIGSLEELKKFGRK